MERFFRFGRFAPGAWQSSRAPASKELDMPRGDKSTYTSKQKRQAEHIEEGYEDRGVGRKEAERRAWATVNKETGGGKKSGSGRGKKTNTASSRKGGRIGGAARARSTAKTARGSAGTRSTAKRSGSTGGARGAAKTTRSASGTRSTAKTSRSKTSRSAGKTRSAARTKSAPRTRKTSTGTKRKGTATRSRGKR
jgi:plasmid stabilization system protein ParE